MIFNHGVAGSRPVRPTKLNRPSQTQNIGLYVEYEVSLLVENQIKRGPARMQDIGLVKVLKETGPNQVKRT